jgi:hypothetical protein
MTAINAFPDKVECPSKTCEFREDPDAKGLCSKRRCPIPQSTRNRWIELYLKNSDALE